ncbi:ABC transporter substrate-binding protein [Mobiluncus mulieris]|uniref:ABC transporter, solute-binding protein n=2 Tax=Mobiluncus mulieris TaxID=2052 RepID=E0QQ61_9ACTO|nr:ABC transporter substrate-binding protein [Mobiluncus mulieris]EEJ54818.1 hypothetical protein HMPREF0577_0341 [Mobiluncus mulieris ATCC 35243]EFM46441.1 hypothetical protein HMPREF0580_0988 [Mobiluncus mulieris ATCC 35239]MCU9970447.1 ABC transporter substrate-binding protein [Mobiluncus mulieris]MCU9975385.1 ABC transporter substrate-binding protein [Mobiluncus mulieris]MCU9993152.1 ABC transporter substrate-binding protein [Mobiluncus mulieris]
MAKKLSQLLAVVLGAAILSGLVFWHNHAAKAGSLQVLCSAAAEVCESWRQDYQALTGQQIAMTRLPTYEAINRMRLFKEKPEFDVWQGGPLEGYVEAQNQGLLQAYQPKDAAAVNPQWRDPKHQWTGIYLGILCFCVNTAVLQKLQVAPPQDWSDLLNPRLRAQISMSAPTSSGTAFNMVATQIERLGHEDAAFAYLRSLDANILQYTKSGVAPANIAARGEVAVGLAFDSHCERSKKTHGAPLRSIYPRSGTGYEVGGVALVKGSQHQKTARAYIDYAVSLRSQSQAMQIGIKQYPTRLDSKHTREFLASKKHLIHLNPQHWAAQRDHLIARYRNEMRGIEDVNVQ